MAHKGGYGHTGEHHGSHHMKHGHMGKHRHAHGHHIGTHGSHEAARTTKKHDGCYGEGLGTGYDAPQHYSGSEDSANAHCC